MALGEQTNLIVSLTLKDQISGALKGIQGQLKSLDGDFSRTKTSLATLGGNVIKAGIVGLGATVGGLAAGFGVSIRAASDFEGELNTINTVAKVNEEQLGAIGDGLRELARESGTSLGDLSAAYYDLVSAGVDAAHAQDVLREANTLAIGGLATTGETVDLLTTAINAYGLEAESAGEIADQFAQAIAAGKLTAGDLAATFAQVAPVAAAAGVEIDELAASYGLMTAAGVPAAQASTQMRAAIIALQAPSEDLLALQEDLGVEFAQVAEEQGLATAYQMIREEADKTGTPMIELLGNVEATGFALQVTGDNADDYTVALEDVRKASEGAGVAAEQAEERQKGLGFQLDRLKAIAHDVAIMFGQEMLPSVTRVTEKVGDLIELNYPKLESLARKVGDAFDEVFSDANLTRGMDQITEAVGKIIDAIGSVKTEDIGGIIKDAFGAMRDIPWQTIADGMKITGEAAKIALDAFKSLPPDVQKGLITLLAANKLSGGLVTSVFRDLAGLALSSLKTITAGHVTVVGPQTPAGAGGKAAGVAQAAPVLIAGVVGGIAAIKVTDEFMVGELGRIREVALQELPNMTEEQRNTLKNIIDLKADISQLPVIRDLFPGITAELQGLRADVVGNSIKGQVIETLETSTVTTQSPEQVAELQRITNNTALLPFAAGQTSEQTAELGRISGYTAVLPFTAGQTAEQAAESQRLNNVVLPWAVDREVAAIDDAAKQTATQLQALRDKLDANDNTVTSMKEVLADKLGVTVDKLQGILHNEEIVAERLGISVEELRELQGDARKIAAEVNAGTEVSKQIRQWAERQVERLDKNHDGIVNMKEVVAAKLGVSIEELRDIETDEERAAERLGITVEQLRAIKADAQSTANDINRITNQGVKVTNLDVLGRAIRRGLTGVTGPTRQSGGPVNPFQLYRINEAGEEGFIPNTPGFVVNHTMMQRLQSSLTRMTSAGSLTFGRGWRQAVPVVVERMPTIRVELNARQVARELRREYEMSFARPR